MHSVRSGFQAAKFQGKVACAEWPNGMMGADAISGCPVPRAKSAISASKRGWQSVAGSQFWEPRWTKAIATPSRSISRQKGSLRNSTSSVMFWWQ